MNDPCVKITTLAPTAFLNMRMRSDRKPFSDPRVRQAFKYIVDRKAIDQVLVNGLSPLGNDTPVVRPLASGTATLAYGQPIPLKAQALVECGRLYEGEATYCQTVRS